MNSSGAAVSNPVSNAGTYTLTVTGQGDYGGSLSQTFIVYNKISTPYLDKDGVSRSVEITPVTSGSTILSAGWYAVTENVTISDRIDVSI